MIFLNTKEAVLMKRFFDSANAYIQQCKWTDMALLKFCLCAMGIMIGLRVPKSGKKPVFIAAAIIFLTTYIPLMVKYILVLKQYFTDCVEDTL